MKKHFVVFICIFFVAALAIRCDTYDNSRAYPAMKIEKPDSAIVELLRNAKWARVYVAPGIVWKSHHFERSDDMEDPEDLEDPDVRQYINIFEIDLNNPNIEIKIPYVTSGVMTTSAAGVANDADIAFNGSFYDPNNVGSTTYLKVDGKEIAQTMAGLTDYLENGAFYLAKAGISRIVKKPSANWPSSVSHNILVSGPVLLHRGERVALSTAAFNTARQARTAIGLTAHNHLIAVVVDGGTDMSEGVGTPELAELMLALGCVDALNLGGGDLSTAWVKGHGVVNHPSGNGQFNSEGEAGTATAFTIKYKQP